MKIITYKKINQKFFLLKNQSEGFKKELKEAGLVAIWSEDKPISPELEDIAIITNKKKIKLEDDEITITYSDKKWWWVKSKNNKTYDVEYHLGVVLVFDKFESRDVELLDRIVNCWVYQIDVYEAKNWCVKLIDEFKFELLNQWRNIENCKRLLEIIGCEEVKFSRKYNCFKEFYNLIK